MPAEVAAQAPEPALAAHTAVMDPSLVPLQKGLGLPGAGMEAIARQAPVPAAYTASPPSELPGATWLDKAENGFKDGTAFALERAWGILNSSPMYDLLPLLAGLKSRGLWSKITAEAGHSGGVRMETAVFTVELKTKGSSITKDDLRALIDRMGPNLYWDQRQDILRFIGKLVVLNVDGLDLDYSYVAGATTKGVVDDVEWNINDAKNWINAYAAVLRDENVKTNADADRAATAIYTAETGNRVVKAGSVDHTGMKTVALEPTSKYQPIDARATDIHETVHQVRQKEIAKKHGENTKEFHETWDNARDYVPDEINARRAEIRFLTKVLGALKTLERMFLSER